MKVMSRSLLVIFILFLSNFKSFSQVYKVIESGNDHIIIEFNFVNSYRVIDTVEAGRTFQKIRGMDYSFRNPGDPWVPEFMVLAGIPFGSKPSFRIIDQKQSVIKNQFIVPFPEDDPAFVKEDFNKINKDIYSRNELFPNLGVRFDES